MIVYQHPSSPEAFGCASERFPEPGTAFGPLASRAQDQPGERPRSPFQETFEPESCTGAEFDGAVHVSEAAGPPNSSGPRTALSTVAYQYQLSAAVYEHRRSFYHSVL